MSDDTPAYSNRERRLRESVADLPAPFPTTRERTGGTAVARHVSALRTRLDWLVDVEERHGEDQRDLHRHRAERNALIWALNELAPLAGQLAASPGPTQPKPQRRAHDAEYVAGVFEECRQLLADGFTVIDPRRPGVLLHNGGEEFAPVEVSLAVWFYVRGVTGIAEGEAENTPGAQAGAPAPSGHE